MYFTLKIAFLVVCVDFQRILIVIGMYQLADQTAQQIIFNATSGAGLSIMFSRVKFKTVKASSLTNKIFRSLLKPMIGSAMLLIIVSIYFFPCRISSSELFLYSAKRSAISLNNVAISLNSGSLPKLSRLL